MIHTSKSKETKKDVIARGSEGHICNMVENIGRYAAEYFEEAMEEEILYEDGLFLLALLECRESGWER